MYRNLLHFYTPVMKNQKEIGKSIPFTTAPKTVRHLGINLTKVDLPSENYKPLIREIAYDTKKWKDILWSQIRRK